jgi:hypothetical protein
LGVGALTVTTGGGTILTGLTVSEAVFEPVKPAASVAFTAIVKIVLTLTVYM